MRLVRRVRRRDHDGGFTIVESVIALGLLFTVVLGLLGALTTGVKGVVTGRQRTVATAYANEVMERARAIAYGEVGHVMTDLSGDPDVTGSGTTRYFGGELLAASSLPGTNAPFNPHISTKTNGGTQYKVRAYVTRPSGTSYKRITAIVTWSGTGKTEVRLSSLMYDAEQPPDPLLRGSADADGGSVLLGGAAIGPDVLSAQRWFSYTHGEVDSQFIKRAKGFGITPRSEIIMKGGSVSVTGGSCTVVGLTGSCPGGKAETIADNDAGTAPPENDAAGPTTSSSNDIETNTIELVSGSGSAQSQSTARSCFTCFSPSIGDDDTLPYQWSIAGGPNGFSTPLASGSVTGRLLRATTSCAAADRCSQSTVDVDKDGAGNMKISSVAATALPAVDVVALDTSLVSLGMVRVSASSVSARAEAGFGAAAPTVTASPITIQMYDTVIDPLNPLDVPGYTSFAVTPGVTASGSTHADLTIGSATATLDASFRTFPRATSYTTDAATGATTHAEARLVDWLQIDVHLVIIQGGGATIDMTVHLEYGRVSAIADFAPAA